MTIIELFTSAKRRVRQGLVGILLGTTIASGASAIHNTYATQSSEQVILTEQNTSKKVKHEGIIAIVESGNTLGGIYREAKAEGTLKPANISIEEFGARAGITELDRIFPGQPIPLAPEYETTAPAKRTVVTMKNGKSSVPDNGPIDEVVFGIGLTALAASYASRKKESKQTKRFEDERTALEVFAAQKVESVPFLTADKYRPINERVMPESTPLIAMGKEKALEFIGTVLEELKNPQTRHGAIRRFEEQGGHRESLIYHFLARNHKPSATLIHSWDRDPVLRHRNRKHDTERLRQITHEMMYTASRQTVVEPEYAKKGVLDFDPARKVYFEMIPQQIHLEVVPRRVAPIMIQWEPPHTSKQKSNLPRAIAVTAAASLTLILGSQTARTQDENNHERTSPSMPYKPANEDITLDTVADGTYVARITAPTLPYVLTESTASNYTPKTPAQKATDARASLETMLDNAVVYDSPAIISGEQTPLTPEQRAMFFGEQGDMNVPQGAKSYKTAEDREQRRAYVAQARARGDTYRTIGENLGMGKTTAHNDASRYAAEHNKLTTVVKH